MDINAVILDLDGVVYRGKQAIPKSDSAVRIFEEKGIKIFYLTNAATRSRADRVKYLKEYNIHTDVRHVYTSGYATAKYIHENISNPRVFYVCDAGLGTELFELGIPVVEHFNANVVAVGLKKRATYHELTKATDAIFSGATFVATNTDPAYPYENTKKPGAGALVKFVEATTQIKPIVAGKPNTYILDYILKEHNLEKEKTLIVGDNLYTDILMANKNEMPSALLLSGMHKREDIKRTKEGTSSAIPKPTHVFKDLYTLATKA